MAYNTKSIIKDLNQKPVPQYWNPDTQKYEVLQGHGGANRVLLYDVTGNPVDITMLISTIITSINTTGTTQLRTGTNSIGKVEVTELPLATNASTLGKQDEIISEIVNGVTDILESLEKQDDIILAITQAVTNILNGLEKPQMEYFGYKVDVKPIEGIIKGAIYFEFDGDVYMFDGIEWVVI